MENITNHINSLSLPPANKAKEINESIRILSREKLIAEHSKNPNKFDKYMNISYKNQSNPDDPTSLASLADSSGEKEIIVADDLSGSIEDAAWGALDPQERRQLIEHLISKDNVANAKFRRELTSTLRNHEVLFQQGKTPSIEEMNKVDLDSCMRVFGNERGLELYNLYQLKRQMSPQVAKIKTMSATEAREFLEKVAEYGANSTLSAEAMVKHNQYHQLLVKAHTDSMQELHKDPIKWGIEHKQIDPISFDTPENFAHSITQRVPFVKNTKDVHGVVSPYFNAEDEKLLNNQLMRSPAHETVQLYQQAYQSSPDSDKAAMETAFVKQNDHILASVARLSMKEDQPRAAQMVLIGAKHKSEIDKDFKADPKSNNKSFDSYYNPYIASYLAPLKRNSVGGHFERNKEAVKLYILGNMKQTNDYTLDRKVIEKASTDMLGNNVVYVNGDALMPPRGMGEDEFRDRLWFSTKSAGEFNPYWNHYVNVGDGLYSLSEYGETKTDKDGNPIVINVRDAPADKLMKEREERERYRKVQIW